VSGARPSQAEVLQQTARAAAGAVKVALPAHVVAYDRDEQRATIQIAIAYRVVDDRAQETFRTRPPVPRVPVVWVGATWDLAAGDSGMVVFADRSIDEWLETGEQSVEPQDARRFDITDAIFIPGLRPFADPLPAAAVAAGAVVLWDRGTSDLRLGSSAATSPVALGDEVDDRLTALANAITSWTPVPNDGGAALKTILAALITAGWPASVGATKVKAE